MVSKKPHDATYGFAVRAFAQLTVRVSCGVLHLRTALGDDELIGRNFFCDKVRLQVEPIFKERAQHLATALLHGVRAELLKFCCILGAHLRLDIVAVGLHPFRAAGDLIFRAHAVGGGHHVGESVRGCSEAVGPVDQAGDGQNSFVRFDGRHIEGVCR
jgi:hypothetical protein